MDVWNTEMQFNELSIDPSLLMDSAWGEASAALGLDKNQYSMQALGFFCPYSFAGGGPKYCIIYTVNKLSSFAPLNVDNYHSF